jgi:hypothetical protein
MKYLLILIITLLFVSCKQPSSDAEKVITDLLFEQQSAWNEGNIKTFMKAYWVSDSLKFIGAKGITYGYNQTYQGYQKRYPDKATMGKLKFEILDMTMLSESAVHMVGKWDLNREMGNIGGHFTLVWKNFDGEWLIISDHTSVR